MELINVIRAQVSGKVVKERYVIFPSTEQVQAVEVVGFSSSLSGEFCEALGDYVAGPAVRRQKDHPITEWS